MIINMETNPSVDSNFAFLNWELNSLFLYLVGITRIRADMIDIDTHSDKDT